MALRRGIAALLLLGALLAGPAARAADAECLDCHEDAVWAHGFPESVHADLGCASCHAGHEEFPHPEGSAPEPCSTCHPDVVAEWEMGVHFQATAAGDAGAPGCAACHGGVHEIRRAGDPASPMHAGRVPDTCGACHAAIRDAYLGSVHGEAALRGVRGAPVCTDCHGEHDILAPSEPGSLVNPARVSTVTCGQCHANERLIARFNLPADRVPTFRDSFHGLSARSGRQTVANCASCHGVHDIRPSSDPASKVHPDNLAATCGACHPGASERYALGPVHVDSAGASQHWTVRAVRIAYLYLILPLALGFMVVHNGIDFVSKVVRGAGRPPGGAQVPRMNRAFRIAHWGVQLSFLTLVLSGFALKYPESWWAAPFLRFEAELPLRGWLHRGAAVLLLAAVAFHAGHLALRRRDRLILHHLLPTRRDARDLLQMIRFNLGLAPERPHFGKFSYGEKLEYLAFVWGTVLMSATGFLLWFENWTLRHLPLWTLTASTLLHWYEAILATLSILIWHLYAVVFDPDVYPMDPSWITGRTSAEHLRRTRPAYFAELTGGVEAAGPRDETGGPAGGPETDPDARGR